MSLNQLQNFYKQTLALAIATTGAGKIYVPILPTVSAGYLVISASNTSKREVIGYDSTGTDGSGNYVNVPSAGQRGMGGTTAQVHDVGESIRMNITAQHWADLITEMALKAPLASPTFTGNVTVPAPSAATDAARKDYVDAADAVLLAFINAQISAINTSLADVVHQSGAQVYVVDSGIVNAMSGATTPAITVLTDGLSVKVKALFANTGAATFALGATGAKPIKKMFNVTLVAGDIKAGQQVELIYDLANTTWQMSTNISSVVQNGGSFQNAVLTYNADGTVATVVDGDTSITYTLAYDTSGRFKSVTNGTNTWTVNYNSNGQATSIVKT